MVGHEAGREDRYANPLLRHVDEREELLVVGSRVEDSRLLVAAIQNVIAVVGNDETSRPWHACTVDDARLTGHSQIRRMHSV